MWRVAKISAVWVWATGLLLFGLAVWRDSPGLFGPVAEAVGGDMRRLTPITQGISVASIAASLFVFMFLVADDLFPRTPLAVSGFLKTFAGFIMWGALIWTLWAVMTL